MRHLGISLSVLLAAVLVAPVASAAGPWSPTPPREAAAPVRTVPAATTASPRTRPASPAQHRMRPKTAQASRSRRPRAIVLRTVHVKSRVQLPQVSIDIAKQRFRLPTVRHLRGRVPPVRRTR